MAGQAQRALREARGVLYWRRAEEGSIHYATGARLELEVGVGDSFVVERKGFCARSFLSYGYNH